MTSHAFHVEQTAPPPSACGGQASACSYRCQSTSRCRGKAIYIRIVHRLRARETESPHRLLCRKLHISGVGPSACTTMLSAGHMVHRTWHALPMPSRSDMRARHLVLNLVLTTSATNPRDELSTAGGACWGANCISHPLRAYLCSRTPAWSTAHGMHGPCQSDLTRALDISS